MTQLVGTQREFEHAGQGFDAVFFTTPDFILNRRNDCLGFAFADTTSISSLTRSLGKVMVVLCMAFLHR